MKCIDKNMLNSLISIQGTVDSIDMLTNTIFATTESSEHSTDNDGQRTRIANKFH